MLKKAISWTNYALGCLIFLLLLSAVGLSMSRPQTIAIPEIKLETKPLPKNTFSRDLSDYQLIGKPFLTLEYEPMKLRLPDLRRHLLYFGSNKRPDTKRDKALMHFSFSNKQDVTSVQPGKKLYMLYDKTQPHGGYVFSPGNQETSLWIEANPGNGDEVLVNAFIKNDMGEIIRNPLDHANFTLKPKRYSRATGQKWEIGDYRVDGTLLARQRARWYGSDLFFEKHGGKEYQELGDKQRINFGEGDNAYSVYVGKDDALIWDGTQWTNAVPGNDTKDFPLLVVNKIDNRLMKLDLWNVDGKGKVTLNLLKSNEKWLPQNFERTFKFVGARTRSQFVFDVKGERMLISPSDWLIKTEDGWEKITTVKQLDEYIQGDIKSPLFIFEGLSKKDGNQVLVGTLFNSTHTDLKTIELPIQQNNSNYDPVVKKKRKKETSDSMAKFSRRLKMKYRS